MGLFDRMKLKNLGRKAYATHSAANQYLNKENIEGAKKAQAEALELYNQYYDQGGDSADVLVGYGMLLMRFEQYEKSLQISKKLLERKNLTKNQSFQAYYNLSIAQWKTGDVDSAVDSMHRAEKFSGRNSTIYNSLGCLLIDQAQASGEFEETRAFLREAYEYDDEDAATLDNIAQMHIVIRDALRAKGETEEADKHDKKGRSFYNRALEIKENLVTSLYALAQLEHEIGKDKHALELLERAEKCYISGISPVSYKMIAALKQEING